ncbi:MAG TPA: hypothetical protein VF800_14205 [Telluria sp.]|jgi:hypothetical protein
MNLQDQVIYRCIDAACARTMPRRVDFCPYCGAAQHEGALRPAAGAAAAPVPPVVAPAAVSVASVAPPVEAPSFVQDVPPAPPAPAAAPPIPTKFVARAAPAAPAGPALRQPIRLRYWLMALAMLGAIWFTAKPESKKIEARIEQATLQAEDCNIKEAQAELAALRSDKASDAQLQRLQSSISAAASACERKRARSARARAAAKRETPAPSVQPAPPAPQRQAGQSARNLIAEADRELAQGNYKAASDKLETCIAMVEGSSECVAFKKHADRLLREMQRCVAAGRDWTNDRCM